MSQLATSSMYVVSLIWLLVFFRSPCLPFYRLDYTKTRGVHASFDVTISGVTYMRNI